MKSILKNKDFDKKGFGYKFMIPWLGEGILISEDKKWHDRRKMLTASFHYSVLESFREQMVEVAQKGLMPSTNHLKFDRLKSIVI